MDQFIRDYNYDLIKTFVADTIDLNNILKNQSNTLNIIQMNIRSMSKNFDEFEIYLENFSIGFDFIILTETWNLADIDRFSYKDYNMIYNQSTFNQNDGVCVFVKNHIKCSTRVVPVSEQNMLEIAFSQNNKKILILAYYRSPASNEERFIESLKTHISSLSNETDIVLFLGDVNIDIKSKKVDETIEDYLNVLFENNFESVINEYTRVQGLSKSCIDHIFLKMKQKHEIIPIVLKSNITDHYSTILQIKNLGDKNVSKEHNGNTIKVINFKKLKELASIADWNTIYSMTNVNKIAEYLTKLVKEIVKSSTNSKNIMRRNRKRKPWITNGLVTSINKRDSLYKKMQANPNNTNCKNEFIYYRNRLNELIKTTKYNYYKNKILKNKNDSKLLWNVIKEMGSSRDETAHDQIKSQNGTVISDSREIADSFNYYFSQVGKKLAEKIKRPSIAIKSTQKNINSLFISPTNLEEVKLVVNNLKSRKAPGFDNLTAEVLKEISHEISPCLVFLINRIIETGEYPIIFKKVLIKPLYKAGDKLNVTNYRPIALITNFSKIMEKILKIRLSSYLEKYNLISCRQFGFQKGKSTQDAISFLTSQICQTIDKSKRALCVFLDLAKAFDTVSHNELLNILEDFGFRGTSLTLFKSYLSGRTQTVQVNNVNSEIQAIQCGVPQGTVLGPILFTMYVNSVLNFPSKGQIISFADDTAILYQSNSWNELKEIAEKDLAAVKNVLDAKLLTINFKKTKFIPFSPYKNNLPEFDKLIINNNDQNFEVSKTDSIKYLGIILDSHLRWDKHINYVTQTLRSLLYKIKYLKNILDLPALKTVYYALIESRLAYGIIGWGSALGTHLNKLEIIQKRIIKIIFNKTNLYPSEELFKESKLLDLRQLYFLNTVVHQYKNKRSLIEIEHTYNTRYKSTHYKTPRTTKCIGQRDFEFLAPRLYNKLPLDIRALNTVSLFKKKVTLYLQQAKRSEIHCLIDMN